METENEAPVFIDEKLISDYKNELEKLNTRHIKNHGFTSSKEERLLDSEVLPMAEINRLNETYEFSEVSQKTKENIYNKCREMLTGDFMQHEVCAICDRNFRKRHCFLLNVTNDLAERCNVRLNSMEILNKELAKHYDVSDVIPSLRNALISRRGLQIDKERNPRLWICQRCFRSLQKGKSDEKHNPPKFAIANGFVIGELPASLKDVTLTERRLTALATFRGHTIVARGGKHKFIKSHILVFASQPDIIKEGMDRVLDDEQKVLLIFTNPMTTAQRKATLKRYEARRGKVNSLLQFYLENNVLYREMGDSKTLNSIQEVLSASQSKLNNMNIIYDAENTDVADQISDDQSNIRRPTVFDNEVGETDETSVHQDSSLFTSSESLEPTIALKMITSKVIDIQQAGVLIPSSRKGYFAKLFPHLFPYGEGHPDSTRKVNVSLQECVKHYLMLSSRRFAQDETFPLISFDVVSRKRAMSHNTLMCKLNPSEVDEIDGVSAIELGRQLEQNDRRREAYSRGHWFTENIASKNAKTLLSRVEAVLGRTYATNEERKIYQRKAWNLAAKYQGAAMFITVTPNENGNATVAAFADELSEKNLARIQLNDIPSHAQRIQISGKDPVACDMFFTSILEMLIDPIIGWDMKRKLPRREGGLFGVPQAFVGGIESQGKGTLHVHLVLFLAGFPRDSSTMLHKITKDGTFKTRLIAFHDSVVSSSSFIDEQQIVCPSCGLSASLSKNRRLKTLHIRICVNGNIPSVHRIVRIVRYHSVVMMKLDLHYIE